MKTIKELSDICRILRDNSDTYLNTHSFEETEEVMQLIEDNIELITIYDTMDKSDFDKPIIVQTFNPSNEEQTDYLNNMYKLGFELISVACINKFKGYYYFKNTNLK